MGIRVSSVRHNAQAAGHAEVNHKRSQPVFLTRRLGSKQQVLGSTVYPRDKAASQVLTERVGNGPTQTWFTYQHVSNRATFDMRRYTPAGGLDFGQLRHGLGLQCAFENGAQ